MTQTTEKPRDIVGPQVRAQRCRLGWSQPVLAAKCQLAGWDISRDIVARIELRIRWVADFELILHSFSYNHSLALEVRFDIRDA